ncbi:MAG TPA: prolyl oligopeptidase family serine peptidase [Gemmataceae bacterium]|jgi:dipeptidyl aminopeptidase/acylaminoacyl peptidase|nr:prolyl oligopeptidase family serine peptidase [Gemmataceae bacterium]
MNRHASIVIAFGLSFALSCAVVHGQDAERTHDVTVDDYFTLAHIQESAISPDGKFVAYAEGRWRKANGDHKADLWVVPTKSGKPTRLTFDQAGERSIRWSPDGKYLYFLANRVHQGAKDWGKTQVWRLRSGGDEPVAVTREAGGVDAFDLAPNGKSVYFTTSRQEVVGDFADLRKKFESLEYGHRHADVTTIRKVSLETWREEIVVELKRAVTEFSVAPDGKRLAILSSPEDKVISHEGRTDVDVVDLSTGFMTKLPDDLWRAKARSRFGKLNSLAWSPDGGRMAFVIGFDGFPSEILVARWPDGTPVVSKLPHYSGITPHAGVDGTMPMQWRSPTELCFAADDHARTRLYSVKNIDNVDQIDCLTPGDVVVEAFSFEKTGKRAVLCLSRPKQMPDLYLFEEGVAPHRLTGVNPQVAKWKTPNLSIVSWKAGDGTTVEGILELPPGAKPGEPLPLLVRIHGGPTWAVPFALNYSWAGAMLFSSHGYAVLSPNYRGSIGYGDKFLTDLIGRENDIEVDDILRGATAMVERKIADPARLGVFGWSNGGYLTNCVIAKTQRFKAASSGAGIADVVLEWGTNDEPAYPMAFMQGYPWTKADAYRKASPIYSFGDVKTPTIFHVGAKDERCPPGNSRMLYRAMKEYLKVPTELIVYPGEPHGLGSMKSRRAKMEWDLAWFGRYIMAEKRKTE